MIEVFNSTDLGEANLVYTLLKDRGFFVRKENEHMNNALGISVGISIMVREEDYADACALLKEAGYLLYDQAEDEASLEAIRKEHRAFQKKMTFILIGLAILLAAFAVATRYLS